MDITIPSNAGRRRSLAWGTTQAVLRKCVSQNQVCNYIYRHLTFKLIPTADFLFVSKTVLFGMFPS